MGNDNDLYNLVLVLHLMAAIVGFGSVFLFGVFGSKAQARGGAEGLAVSEITVDVGKQWSEWFIYAVPVFGILLVLLSEDTYEFSQAWISMSFLFYVVGIGLSHAVHFPNLHRMNELARELVSGGLPAGGEAGGPPPQVAELEARGKKAAAVGAALNLMVVAIVVLMVWKPGFPS